MVKKKYVPIVDALSLCLLFFLGFFYNLFGSYFWEIFFSVSIVLVFLGSFISIIYGNSRIISRNEFLNRLIFAIYVAVIIIGLRYLFQYLQISNVIFIIDHFILILFFFVLFILSLREIFINLYSGKRA